MPEPSSTATSDKVRAQASPQTALETSTMRASLAMTCEERKEGKSASPRKRASQPLRDRSTARTHIVARDRVALGVTGPPTLRGEAETLESLLPGLVGALGNHVGGLVDARNEVFLLLHLRELAREEAEDDDLVGGEVGEGLWRRADVGQLVVQRRVARRG